MDTRQYLIDTFRYNDHANKLALSKMAGLTDRVECISLFSHLINSMNKWLARIDGTPGYAEMDWWLPVYRLDELESKWDECLQRWLRFLERSSDERLAAQVTWYNPDIPAAADGAYNFAAAVVDIALQLNYHSIHHRAQIQYLIRRQGIEPDFVDYIGTKYRQLV